MTLLLLQSCQKEVLVDSFSVEKLTKKELQKQEVIIELATDSLERSGDKLFSASYTTQDGNLSGFGIQQSNLRSQFRSAVDKRFIEKFSLLNKDSIKGSSDLYMRLKAHEVINSVREQQLKLKDYAKWSALYKQSETEIKLQRENSINNMSGEIAETMNALQWHLQFTNYTEYNWDQFQVIPVISFDFETSVKYYIGKPYTSTEVLNSKMAIAISNVEIIDLSNGFIPQIFKSHKPTDVTLFMYLRASNKVGYNLSNADYELSKVSRFIGSNDQVKLNQIGYLLHEEKIDSKNFN